MTNNNVNVMLNWVFFYTKNTTYAESPGSLEQFHYNKNEDH